MDKHGRKIGLLGGSFNPAHDGHVHISHEALNRLQLDEIWWLVSPQNPLKPANETADFEERLLGAKQLADDPRILISDVENSIFTPPYDKCYSIKTIHHLHQTYPEDHFVWLMGTDNLIQIPKWHQWQDIFYALPIAILDREDHAEIALKGEAVTAFSNYRIAENQASLLVTMPAPAWVYLWISKHPASSTAIRNNEI